MPYRSSITESLAKIPGAAFWSPSSCFFEGPCFRDAPGPSGVLRGAQGRPVSGRHRSPPTWDFAFTISWQSCQTFLRAHHHLRDFHPSFLPSLLSPPLGIRPTQKWDSYQASPRASPIFSHRNSILSWHVLFGGPRITQSEKNTGKSFYNCFIFYPHKKFSSWYGREVFLSFNDVYIMLPLRYQNWSQP